ncbi:MAG: FkbM family methyltransferase [Candidatus Acidiferrales bacterium]
MSRTRHAARATVYAFEPLPECCTKLQARLGRSGRFTAYQVALGEAPGTVNFRQSSFAKSSSVLPMARMDDYRHKIEMTPKVLLKIDTQA